MSKTETRTQANRCEVRQEADGSATIGGYAAVFNSRSQNLGGFVEQIAPGAFSKTLQEADVRALVNHDPNWVIGRGENLRLSVDGTGLQYEVDVNLNDPDGRRAVEKVRSGLIDGSSFGFLVIDDDWGLTDDDFPLRTLNEVALRDVGPATFPAYLDASVGARALSSLAAAHEREAEALVGEPAEIRSLIENKELPKDKAEKPGQTPTSDPQFLRKRLMLRRTPGPGDTHPDEKN